MSDGHSPWVRGFLVVVMAIGVLGFGAIGLCGGYFTADILKVLASPDARGASAMMIISVPSLVGGCFMVWLCIRQIVDLLRPPSSEEPADE